MKDTLVILVVGLSPHHIGPDTPHLQQLTQGGGLRPLKAVTPAVTCSAQATFVTGQLPTEHGIVANGWYFRDLAETWFWRQSNHLVQAPKLWEVARDRDPSFSCAKLFWWYNMYSSADWSMTPRPMYPADGRKLPDTYSSPPELRDEMNRELGQFPLFHFWGPLADIRSSRWIKDAALRLIDRERPTLSLVYLPHLDYNLQRLGPNHPTIKSDLRQVDALCGELIDQAKSQHRRVMVLSEYGIVPVTGPVHLNRALRKAGYIALRTERGHDLLDCGACGAFAVSDHQIAHIYVKDPSNISHVRSIVEATNGVEAVYDRQQQKTIGLAHERSGELVAISQGDRWFSYYFWEDEDRAPDYARTVDIHRKPGYDPVELFFDPKLPFPKLRAARRVLGKKLGMRNLMDVIGLDDSIVRGSHGRVTDREEDGPLIISDTPELLPEGQVDATHVRDLILSHVFDH